MKKEAPLPTKHFEEAQHEAIHHPEDDETVLARGLAWLMLQGPKIWVWALGLVVIALLAWFAVGRIMQGDPTAGQAWKDYMLAGSSTDQQKLIEEYPNTKASAWAKLQLAEDYCGRAFSQLPGERIRPCPS